MSTETDEDQGPDEASALIDDLVRRTGEVARAAQLAIGDLDRDEATAGPGGELVGTIVDSLHDVNAECERIHGILERVAPLIAGAPLGDPVADGPGTTWEDEDEDAGDDGYGEPPIAVPADDFVRREPLAAAAYEGTGATELSEPPSEGVRLLATQMAVAGETIAEIERRLRADFGVADAHLVVRELFGPDEGYA